MIGLMTMKKGFYWALQIIALALAAKFGLWAYENFRADGQHQQQEEVLDIDKLCLADADTGFCVCRHRWTNERLDLPHEECLERSRQP
ncbi:MAG: hypothetical protein OQK99_00995 [Gammaproteobacteria bacterium]|nr:hypothetical protein [Gammaproteobacteria bacterium]